ncbi:MAG: acetyl-CoA decarbonylase/synthase complex subunit gamma [Deltaproteobacteria bacterium]|nr:acetyl-CoA decarbonylase/synthase complex subunit gamma [Deltaproteobacteria bacterium]MBW2051623.1 acetyl-CoA decarbonylase/synthase complex subunit gamma [Deltaproteobacteria bacterium]MBW2141273.1 acetyl-CoA decarbonylase/synthase complex subunit gamma [Deltaproteobacteria bacterium]MBW2323429.1 acetyl-CoA decarbonylase/synthase complex subunit gamma [Deltaproteobacteria bacterium]
MALTGIQIFKLLPKTNCKECGVPTCLAFAMNLAAGKADLDACPYVSDESRAVLAEASAPPIRPLTVGYGDTAVKMGGETVLFRHEKTFFSPPGIAALITDDTDPGVIEEKCQRYMAYQYERVGLNLRPELIALKAVNGDGARFADAAKLILDKCDLSLILMSEDSAVIKSALDAVGDSNPLIYAATAGNVEEMGNLALDTGCPLAVKADSVDSLIPLTEKLIEMGLKDLVLDSGARTVKQSLEDSVAIRRAALLAQDRTLGYPTITFPCEMTDNLAMQTAISAGLIAKYAGIIVLSDFEGSVVFPLLLERLNIFTDPQRPMTVTQGIYEINGPDENSPVLVTSNFSLTYFIVSGEIEASRVPTWLAIMDTEGLSVLTAWAAGKFVGDAVGMFIKKSDLSDKIKHQNLVIPGYSAAILGDLEEELPGWNITIGPREAAHIPKFLKEYKIG